MATDADQFSLRIDHKFSAKDQFFARFNFDNLTGPTTNPDQTAIDPAFGVQYIDRQRNVVGTYTRTVSPRLTLESSVSITRSTPGFPTPDHTDPAIKFNDGLFEAFNTAAGSVMQAYGNLFQGRQNVVFTTARHAFKAGFEIRINRDTTYFGISPNGEYDFGGGTAYATRVHSVAKRNAQYPSRRSAARYALQLSLRQSVLLHRGHCASLLFQRPAHRPGRHQPQQLQRLRRRTHGR